eukprot:397782-Amphidinium_carterae.1
MGLYTIMKNGLHLTVDGYRGYLANDQTEVKLHYIANHFYLKATLFDGLYSYVDYTKDFASWYYDWYDVCCPLAPLTHAHRVTLRRMPKLVHHAVAPPRSTTLDRTRQWGLVHLVHKHTIMSGIIINALKENPEA